MWTLAQLQARRTEIMQIAERYGARDVQVFGSVAREQADDRSDIDLLVRFDPDVTLFQRAAMIRDLESILGCRVDVVSERSLRPRVRDRVLVEAVPL